MELYLVDGTYELFRNYYSPPRKKTSDGREVGAVTGLIRTLAALLRDCEVTHIACAFDSVVESFRNRLFAGYKSGEGVPADLLAQFAPAERAAASMGIVVWPMVEFEADDALATACARWSRAFQRILICSPDKDLAQCVVRESVVVWDRRRNRILDERGVQEKFGVPPASIPDWLALVGDSADGIPGIPGWGEKSASTVLARFSRLEAIPRDEREWGVSVRGAVRLAATLEDMRDEAILYRRLATLRTDVPLPEEPKDLRWRGADRERFREFCSSIESESLVDRIPRWA